MAPTTTREFDIGGYKYTCRKPLLEDVAVMLQGAPFPSLETMVAREGAKSDPRAQAAAAWEKANQMLPRLVESPKICGPGQRFDGCISVDFIPTEEKLQLLKELLDWSGYVEAAETVRPTDGTAAG